jgi:hypothetical protein
MEPANVVVTSKTCVNLLAAPPALATGHLKRAQALWWIGAAVLTLAMSLTGCSSSRPPVPSSAPSRRSVHQGEVLAPPRLNGNDCLSGPKPCQLPPGIYVSVTSVERRVKPPQSQKLPGGEVYVMLGLRLRVVRDYAGTGGEISVAAAGRSSPPWYADLDYRGTALANRPCRVPSPPVARAGAGGTVGPVPVLHLGVFGPVRACFAVAATSSSSLHLSWTVNLVTTGAGLGSQVEAYTTERTIPPPRLGHFQN